MGEPTDRHSDTERGVDESLRQPAQEIVDPRAEHPDPDAPNVEISAAREPGTGEERSAHRVNVPTDVLTPEEGAAFSDEQRSVFTDSYRAALEEFGDEGRARDVARAAARGTPGDR